MNAKSKTLFCFIVLLSFGHFVRATHKNPASTGPVLRVVNVQGEIDPHLPHIRRERQLAATSGGYPWEMRPQMYGFTAPPAHDRIWFPAEFDPTAEIILGWPSYAFDKDGRLKILELREIVRHSLGITKVSIILQDRTKPLVEETLRAAKLDPEKIEMITFPGEFPDNGAWSTLDTVWMRDYGPQFVYGSSPVNRMNLDVIDPSYYPLLWASKSNPAGRVRDDAAPTRLAALRGLPSYRPRLIAEGGDFMTDGDGTCFVSDRLPITNRIVLGSANEWNDTLARFYGCRRIIVLEGLKGESTGHLDMFMTVLSATAIFVGKYNPAYDSVNAERLDKNSHILMASGYKVTRIPMPTPYSIASSRIWATFTNIVRINGRMLVPVYRNPNFPARLRAIIRKQEAEALKKFRQTLPGVSVVPVAADTLIPAGGSLHCIVVNLPRRNVKKK